MKHNNIAARTAVATALVCLMCGTARAQRLAGMNRQVQFRHIVPAGNYSGISHVVGNTYALADDKAPHDGFRLVDIDIDPQTGDIKSVADRGFVQGGDNGNRDAEGIAVLPHRQAAMVVGEADSRIVEYTLGGKPTGRTLALEKGTGNGGYESLAYDTARALLLTCTENPLARDMAATGKGEAWRFRIQAFDEATLSMRGSWLYEADRPAAVASKAALYAFGISELTALPDERVLVLERECYVPKKKIGAWVVNKIYAVTLHVPGDGSAAIGSGAAGAGGTFSHDLYGATVPVAKTLLCQWKTRMTITSRSFANYEGMCLGPRLADGRQVVLLVADSQNQAKGLLRDWFKTIVIE